MPTPESSAAKIDRYEKALREIGLPAHVPQGFDPLDWWQHTASYRLLVLDGLRGDAKVVGGVEPATAPGAVEPEKAARPPRVAGSSAMGRRSAPRVSVSYKERWWHRRRFACGNVTLREARDTYRYLRRQGRRPRLHLERPRIDLGR